MTQPEFVAPFVVAVCHPDGPDASGKVFEAGAGYVAEIRWERSNGAVFKTDASFTPSAVSFLRDRGRINAHHLTRLKPNGLSWSTFRIPPSKLFGPFSLFILMIISPESVTDIDSKVDCPIFPSLVVLILSTQGKLEIASKLPPNPQSSPEIRFDGKTVVITGAGAGLGKAYALMYGKLGANVVINDVSEKGANSVVDEVVKGPHLVPSSYICSFASLPMFAAGGKAVAVICSAEDGETIVKAAVEKFGGVHILIANAGILRDKSFQAMTEQEWDIVMAVHLR